MSFDEDYNFDLTPERKEELIEKISTFIVGRGLDFQAVMILESIKPLSYIGTQLGTIYVGPFLPFLGGYGNEAIGLLQDRENIEALIVRIEDLAYEYENRRKAKTLETAQKEIGKKKKSRFSFLNRFRR